MIKGKYFSSFDGVKIWYAYKKGRKPCLIFLHGFTGSSSAWEQIYPYFIEKGHSVMLVDYRGHGFSDKPKTNSIKTIAEDLKLIMDKESIDKAVFIGHCYGSLLIQQFYRTYPEKITKMVLINSNYKISKNLFHKIINFSPYVLYLLFSVIISPLNLEKNRVHEDYTKFIGSHDFDPKRIYTDIRVTSFRTFLPLYKEIISLDFTEVISKSDVPVLLIHGKHDMIFSVKNAYKMHDIIKNSRLHIIDGNHIVIITNAKEVTEQIEEFI